MLTDMQKKGGKSLCEIMQFSTLPAVFQGSCCTIAAVSGCITRWCPGKSVLNCLLIFQTLGSTELNIMLVRTLNFTRMKSGGKGGKVQGVLMTYNHNWDRNFCF